MRYLKPAAIFFGVLFVGYFSYKILTQIPARNFEDAQAFIQSLDRQQKALVIEQDKFSELTQSDAWALLSPYAASGNWAAKFTAAEADLAEAEKIKADVVDRILERDHEDDVAELVAGIAKGVEFIRSSKLASAYPLQRAEHILEAVENKAVFFQGAEALIGANDRLSVQFKLKLDRSLAAHPAKNADIKAKEKTFFELVDASSSAFAAMRAEYRSAAINYAHFIDSYADLKTAHQNALSFAEENAVLLAQLDRSYVKILVDQQIDYYLVIARASWCDGEYCGSGSEIKYPAVKVDEDTFDFFESNDVSVIARHATSFGGGGRLSLLIPKQRWDALGIDYQYRWDRSEPSAEYWVDSAAIRPLHKYATIEAVSANSGEEAGGEVNEQDWESVSEAVFLSHYEHLGMAIETKPFGYYESELIDTAEPLGMASIATPIMVNGVPTGSNQQGEWRQGSGGSFFYFYGMSRMFSDFGYQRRYSHNDWRQYNANGRSSAFYGSNRQYGTYGSATYSGSRYANSNFGRRNPSVLSSAVSGGGSGIGGSIRGAGPFGRGKGPSGPGK
ncbi:hypothetical protein N9Q31_06035 [Pseudomonadales bacterium]|nr:hypothetical protein [Pseudomonadales bacterium]